MIKKFFKFGFFRKKKPSENNDDMSFDDMEDAAMGMDDEHSPAAEKEDIPFHKLSVEEQWERLPKRPLTRRKKASKALLLLMPVLPVVILFFLLVPVLDPQTGWMLYYLDQQKQIAVIPGTERELQEEIAQGVRDMEDRNNAQEQAQAQAARSQDGNLANDTDGGAASNTDQQQSMSSITSENPETMADMDQDDDTPDGPITPDPLRPAPLPGLEEEGSYGRIPVIGKDGTTPFDAYKRPFTHRDGDVYVAIMVTGIGLNQDRTEQAIKDLPLNISLSLSPYSSNLKDVARQARAMGHEIFLEVPMEPSNFPLSDPGPRALLTSLPDGENLVRLEWLMARFPGYAGIISMMGSEFISHEASMRPIIEVVTKTGLMYVEGSSNGAVSYGAQIAANDNQPNAITNIAIDEVPSSASIDRNLRALVAQAKKNGVAVGIAQSYPVTLKRLKHWASRLKRQGVVLAPVSALANYQVRPQTPEEIEAEQNKSAANENAEQHSEEKQADAPKESH